MVLKHHTLSPFDRKPQGAVAAGGQVRLRVTAEGDQMPLELFLRVWNGAERRYPMRSLGVRNGKTVYEAQIGVGDTPNLLWYRFEGETREGRVVLGAPDDHTGCGEGVMGSEESFQVTVYDAAYDTPAWMREGVMYQIMVDRFCRGEGTDALMHAKDGQNIILHDKWDEMPFLNISENGDNFANDFFGGNLEGVRQKLPYLKRLGVSVLYFNPIFCARTNHKYDTSDYRRIDPMFGDEQALVRLCEDAKKLGMHVMLDGVFNHVGRSFPAFRDALAGHGHESMFHITRNAGGGVDYRRFEGHPELPELNHDSEEVVRLVTDVMLHWLRRGASAWRLDAAYAVSPAFWTRVLPAVRREFPDVWIMGEVIHGDYPAIVRQSGMDSLTQYELWKAIWSSLESANFYELDWSLKRHNEFLESFAPQTFVGNHDVTRIASRVGDAGASLAMTVLFTVGGVPSIYYGDEQAFRGVKEDRMGGDDAVRPAFPASPDDLPGTGEWMYRLIQGLIGIRRRNPWLTHAMTTPVTVDNRRYAYDAVGHGGERLHVELSLDPAPHAVVSGSDGTVLMRVQHGD